MEPNPLIDDLRQAGVEYVDSFKGNWKALIEDLRKRAIADGKQLVKLQPQPTALPKESQGHAGAIDDGR